MEFIFKTSPKCDEKLKNQLISVLEKRIENHSRSVMPKIWEITDRLNQTPKADEKTLKIRRGFRKINGIILLALGLFLFIPSVLDVEKMKFTLFMGAFGIIMGFLQFKPIKIKTNKGVVKEAEKLYKSWQEEETGVIIRANTQGLHLENGKEMFKFSDLDSVFDTDDGYFFFVNESLLALQKKDMTEGNTEEFQKILPIERF